MERGGGGHHGQVEGLRSLPADEPLQAQQAQPGAADEQGVGGADGNPGWQPVAQQNQEEPGRLRGEIQRPEAEAGVLAAGLAPQGHHDEVADQLDGEARDDDGFQVEDRHGGKRSAAVRKSQRKSAGNAGAGV